MISIEGWTALSHIGTGVSFSRMHQIGFIRWSNDRREQKATPGKNAGISRNRKLWLLVPALVVHRNKSLGRLSTALGLITPPPSPKTTQCSFCIFVLCFRLLCSSGLVRARQSLLFVKVFPIPWRLGMRNKGHRCFRHNSDWNSETSSGGREKGEI